MIKAIGGLVSALTSAYFIYKVMPIAIAMMAPVG